MVRRVYLYGGASSNGAAHASVPVYTPIVAGREWQVILPPGEFCRTSVTQDEWAQGWGPAAGTAMSAPVALA
jgi:hypothetical protein